VLRTAGKGDSVMALAGKGRAQRSFAFFTDLEFTAEATMKKVIRGEGETFETGEKFLLSRKINLLPSEDRK
jgi:hypothetical protein|tara:strand:+ start:2512 stop:2724 length:213 start_codon:yes stop_codon:yes gene_type:complete